jgi:WD repeat-containing protein 35
MASVRCREHMTDNTSRAHESAAGTSDIQDELSEAITLSGVNVLVGEWVPFGSNTIVALNEKLSTSDRCQGGMFTGEADKDADKGSIDARGRPTHVLYQPPKLAENTEVKILDYDMTECINFEANIKFEESPGIIQVEEFGMHVSCEGFICYAMKVEAINERLSDDISIDLLSRLLVDVCDDSSAIAQSLLSFYQKSLLEMVYNGDQDKREKFNLLVCGEQASVPRDPL